MLNLKAIVAGYWSLLFPNKEIKMLSKERLSICKGCIFNSTKGKITMLSYCLQCKCNLKAKASCTFCKCPLPTPKWDAQVSMEEILSKLP